MSDDKKPVRRFKINGWTSVNVNLFEDREAGKATPYVHIWRNNKNMSLSGDDFRRYLCKQVDINEAIEDMEVLSAELLPRIYAPRRHHPYSSKLRMREDLKTLFEYDLGKAVSLLKTEVTMSDISHAMDREEDPAYELSEVNADHDMNGDADPEENRDQLSEDSGDPSNKLPEGNANHDMNGDADPEVNRDQLSEDSGDPSNKLPEGNANHDMNGDADPEVNRDQLSEDSGDPSNKLPEGNANHDMNGDADPEVNRDQLSEDSGDPSNKLPESNANHDMNGDADPEENRDQLSEDSGDPSNKLPEGNANHDMNGDADPEENRDQLSEDSGDPSNKLPEGNANHDMNGDADPEVNRDQLSEDSGDPSNKLPKGNANHDMNGDADPEVNRDQLSEDSDDPNFKLPEGNANHDMNGDADPEVNRDQLSEDSGDPSNKLPEDNANHDMNGDADHEVNRDELSEDSSDPTYKLMDCNMDSDVSHDNDPSYKLSEDDTDHDTDTDYLSDNNSDTSYKLLEGSANCDIDNNSADDNDDPSCSGFGDGFKVNRCYKQGKPCKHDKRVTEELAGCFTHDHDMQDEIDILRDRKHPKVYIRKLKQQNVGTSTKRVYNNFHCCLLCGQLKSNMRKHIFLHKENKDVKQLIELKGNGKQEEALVLQKILRNKGDHHHNMTVKERCCGELIISRRPGEAFSMDEYGPCCLCYEWIKINLSTTKHQETCPMAHDEKLKKGEAIKRSTVLSGDVSPEASQKLVTEVYAIMTRDEVSAVAQNDELIVALGNFWFHNNIGNKHKRKYYTSSRMRGAARLLQHLRNNDQSTLGMKDYLKPSKFDEVVHAALQCASMDEDDSEVLKHPSAALKVGHDITRLLCIKLGLAKRDRENSQVDIQETKDFLSLLKLEWTNKVTKLSHKLLRERKMYKSTKAPSPDDLARLALYLKSKLETFVLVPKEADEKTYRDVSMYTLARLLVYNKRRSGELEQMLLLSYENRSVEMDDSDTALMGDLTKTEKALLGSQEIIKIEGKAEQTVPVLVPPDVKEPLQYVTNTKVRRKANVNTSNTYVFANTGGGTFRAYDALKRACLEADISCPERINSVSLRKYFATMSQVIGMKDHQIQWICKHLGHSFNVHDVHYRGASGYIERMNIGKLMLMQDFNCAGRFKGMALEDIQVDDILKEVEKEPEPFVAVPDQNCVSDEVVIDAEVLPIKKKKFMRQVWTLDEEKELRSLFASNFQSGQCPKQKDVEKAVHASRISDGMIHKRKWEVIKKKCGTIDMETIDMIELKLFAAHEGMRCKSLSLLFINMQLS